MAAKGLFSTIDSASFEWKSSEAVTGTNGAYLTAIKSTPTANDTIPLKTLKYIILELGIDSGISGKPITVANIKLNFSEQTSTDADLNDKTAMTKIGVYPTPLYYRVLAFADQTKEYTSGKLPVSINTLTF